MSRVEIFLWPLAGFLLVAALATAMKARNGDPAARTRAIILAALAAAVLLYLFIGS